VMLIAEAIGVSPGPCSPRRKHERRSPDTGADRVDGREARPAGRAHRSVAESPAGDLQRRKRRVGMDRSPGAREGEAMSTWDAKAYTAAMAVMLAVILTSIVVFAPWTDAQTSPPCQHVDLPVV